MPKGLALKDFVSVDGVDLSDFASAVAPSFQDTQVDVSGFNAAGTDENIPGTRAQSVQVTFFGSYGAGEVHETLYHLYKARDVFAFAWRPDQTIPVGVGNPSLQGNVQLLDYSPSRTRGQADSFQVTFVAADSAGLDYAYS